VPDATPAALFTDCSSFSRILSMWRCSSWLEWGSEIMIETLIYFVVTAAMCNLF
jgi:hypothetical protein